jgi:hypothetical protein
MVDFRVVYHIVLIYLGLKDGLELTAEKLKKFHAQEVSHLFAST